MKQTINAYDLNDKVLKEYGFTYLTSESCAYSMRVLLDINQNAEDILSEFLGNNVTFNNAAWNGLNGEKHSVMLTRSMLHELALFILLHKCAILVYYDGKRLQPFYRMYDNQDELDQDKTDFPFLNDSIVQVWHGSMCDRNRHVFSGRLD